MNESLDLIRKVCAGEHPSRTPIFDLLSNDAIVEHFAGRPLDGKDDMAVMCDAAGRCLDGTREITPPHQEGARWTDPMGNLVVADRWTTWIETYALTDEDAWVKWIGGEIERQEATPDPDQGALDEEIARQQALNKRLHGTVNISCAVSTAVNEMLFGYHCGLEMLSYLWADEPDLVLRWFRAIERAQLQRIALTGHSTQSPLAIIYSDIAFKGRLMFSRDMLKAWGFFDDVARICAACHERDLTVIFHSDGYIMEIVADLVAAGIDGLNPIEKAAGMDIYDLHERYPDLILVGGLDVTHLLPHGTPEEVRAETSRMLDIVGREGRFLIGSSTELGDDVPLENYLAFHDVVMQGGST